MHIIKKVNLETVCGVSSVLPKNRLPEVAFAGKSNVGKSSLINGLINRKAYARTSAQPGKTQTINYYKINEELYFVDLPGYGYTKVARSVNRQWGKFVEDYLYQSEQLRLVFLLIDIRHAPSENDRMMYEWIVSHGFHPTIIATKVDKLKRSQVAKHVRMVEEGLDTVEGTPVVPYSALTKQGRDEIWTLLEKYVLGWEEA